MLPSPYFCSCPNPIVSGDFHVINGVLRTAHSLFKRYRYEFKSQKLWEEIKHVLENFAKPLTDLFVVSMLCFSNGPYLSLGAAVQSEKVVTGTPAHKANERTWVSVSWV